LDTIELLNLENHKARALQYSSRTENRELYERLRAEHRHLYKECYVSYMDGIENGIDLKRFFDIVNYKRKRRLVFLSQCDMTVWWVIVPLTPVSSFPISLRVSIM
jgi:hypothetical protein